MIFGPPGTSKIDLPPMAAARCVEILLPARGTKKAAQNDPQKVPKKDPRKPPEGPKRELKAMLGSSFTFEQFWDEFADPQGTQNEIQNQSRLQLGPPGVAQGRQRPPGGLQGAIFEAVGESF